MDLLTFHLGDREFAVDLRRVVEIISPPPITRVPDMPPVVRGLIGLRGEPTAVLDGGVRLTGRRVEVSARSPIVILSASQDDRELRYGVLVDAAGRKASVDTLLPWSASQENVTDDDACVGFAEVEGALVLVLDVDALLQFRSARSVDDAPAATALADPADRPAPGGESAASGRGARAYPPNAASAAPTTATAASPARASPTAQPRSSPAASSPAAETDVRAPPAPPPCSAPPTAAARVSTHLQVAASVARGAAAHAATMPPAATQPRAAAKVTSPARAPIAETPFAPRHEVPPHVNESVRPPSFPRVEVPAPRFAPAPMATRPESHRPPPAAEPVEAEKRGVPLVGWIAAAAAILLAIALLSLTRGRSDRGEAVAARSARPSVREAAPEPSRAPATSVASLGSPPMSPPVSDPAPLPTIGEPRRSAPFEPGPERGSSPPPAPAPAPAPAPEPPVVRTRRPLPPSMVVGPDTPACEVHEVRKGDTLWWISARKLGDPYRWPELFGENRELLQDPDVIEVHDRIRIPGACEPHR